MAYHIKDQETDRLLRQLARTKRKSMADVIREALAEALAREEARTPLWDRLAPVRETVEAARTRSEPIDWEALKRENDENWGL